MFNNNYTTSSYDYYLVPTSNEEYLSKDYLENQAWYTPSYDPDTFDSNMEKILNDYEKANIETIKEIEAERK